jgi:hypothetical protein
MQTIVRPVASLPGAWDVEFSGGWVGQIQKRFSGFLIVPLQPTVLSGRRPERACTFACRAAPPFRKIRILEAAAPISVVTLRD